MISSAGNLILATVAFAMLFTRFSGTGISLVKFVFLGLVITLILSIRDLWRANTRAWGFLALLLCLPVLTFFGILTVWEGPLYVAAIGVSPVQFRIDGAAGFHGLAIYSPEHRKAEWQGDEIGLVWSLDWQRRDKFPPMKVRFAYGILPTDFSQKTPPSNGAPPALDPEATYTVVIQPAMGIPEYFSLHGNSLVKAENEFGPDVCWGALPVASQRSPAYVRVDCGTKKFLPMSQRAQERLKAYQEKRIVFY
jgi:hypothetical protein